MTIKSKCDVQVPCVEKTTFTAEQIIAGKGSAYTPYEHPDLLRSLRALSDYHHWVESRLMPIAGKWMEEHKSEYQSTLSAEQQDDIGASIEAAYQVVARSAWWERVLANSTTPGFVDGLLKQMVPNPIWQRESQKFFAAEEDVKSAR